MCLYHNNNQNAQVGKENKQGDCLDGKKKIIITPFLSQVGGKSFRPRLETCKRHCTLFFVFSRKELEVNNKWRRKML